MAGWILIATLTRRIASLFPPAGAVRKRRPLLWVGLLGLATALAAWTWWPRGAAPEDPRLTFATPFRNVRPDVKYVGDQACAGCHARHARTYRDHPMGRSLAPVASARPVERYDETAKNPFDALGYQYQVKPQGAQVSHRETATDALGRVIVETEAEVHFAVGSGTRGRSYLINRDGYLFQSPITWFPQKGEEGAWDFSPGYDRLHHHFGRPVAADCLFCHSNRALDVADTQNRYVPPIFDGYAIGCERCHGPGELHVRRQHATEPADDPDDTIVNPGRLAPALRDAVCEQCHLQGVARVLPRGRQTYDFRPGLPLHLFLAIYVKPPADAEHYKFVSQVEQMRASGCYRGSAGRMGCISCHDPHVAPAAGERAAYYRDRCLQCHADRGCSVPVATRRQTSPGDRCVQCHMPVGASADIQHTAITDHRILRRPGDAAAPGPMVPALAAGGGMPMVLFHRDQVAENDPDAARNLGVALVERVERYPAPVRRRLAELALPRLQAALRGDATDVTAWDAQAHALWALGDAAGAAASFDDALARAPRREITLQWAAALALERKRPQDAVSYLERAVKVNPWRHEFHSLLAEAHAQGKAWPSASRHAREALRLNPTNITARRVLIEYYLQVGQSEMARTEFDRLLGLHPPGEEGLRDWFARRLP
jgi:predicted CXXCH cytochrome family protein